MLRSFEDFSARIDKAELRVRRPSQTIFLCGGIIDDNVNNRNVTSIRDYIVRYKNGQNKISANIVLAETARQLYRETRYSDLISFEEDIARIASLVLVICESAGSLAELAAFASESIIRDTLRIIISEKHATDESFVRYGPVRRIENIDRERVGIFPWKMSKTGVVKSSINPHFSEIIRWINDHVKKCSETFSYNNLSEDKAVFFNIIWILSLLEAAPPEPLYDAVRIFHPNLTNDNIRDKLFSLKICQWIGDFSYAGRDYYYLPENKDPYEYAFIKGMRPRDIAASKVDIANEFRAGAGINKAVIRRLQHIREQNL